MVGQGSKGKRISFEMPAYSIKTSTLRHILRAQVSNCLGEAIICSLEHDADPGAGIPGEVHLLQAVTAGDANVVGLLLQHGAESANFGFVSVRP